MTITAHAVTGSLVAVATGDVFIGIIAAILSHFIIDMIPHWNQRPRLVDRSYIVWADLLAGMILVVLLSLTIKAPVYLIMAGAIAGVAPDLMWLPEVLEGKDSPRDKKTILHWLRRKHSGIQTSETGPGFYVELAWTTLMLVLIYANYR